MNLGLKIEGGQMEVGFTVSSLVEFDECVSKLTVMAEALWPPTDAAPEKVDEPSVKDIENEIVRKTWGEAQKDWRDAQGLR